jgi:uncharacterized OB-fold protein
VTSLLRALDAPPTAERERIDFAGARLIGSRCVDCRWTAFPPRAACARCHGVAVEPHHLARQGELRTWTRVWVPVEGVRPPYLLGLVQLEGVQVFAHVRELAEDVTVPAPVRLEVSRSGRPPFWFVPA